MPTLEPLSPHLVAEFKSVRLRALQDTPTAFGSTYAKESQLTQEDWLTRTAAWNCGPSVCYLAMENGTSCGIIAGYLDKENPQRTHVASMWVAPTHRRTGLGSTLIQTVQLWAQNLGARELRLQVTNNNAAAIRFYEQYGFTSTGVTEPYPNDPKLVALEMIKPLHSA
jgi:ribosomal protein S18 acetylase RimI-like enzyme